MGVATVTKEATPLRTCLYLADRYLTGATESQPFPRRSSQPPIALRPHWDCRVSHVFAFHRAKLGAADALFRVAALATTDMPLVLLAPQG
jgi:hypothetical protein